MTAYPQAVRNPVEHARTAPFHVKHGLWLRRHQRDYPQVPQAIYVVFHVKPSSLWITSVDNFPVVSMSTEGDALPSHGGYLNG